MKGIKEEVFKRKRKKQRKRKTIDSIDIKKGQINDMAFKKKYSLKSGFKANTREAQLSKEIAEGLNDTDNFALYRSAVQDLGYQKAYEKFRETIDDMRRNKGSEKEIKNPGALFTWKVNRELKKRGGDKK